MRRLLPALAVLLSLGACSGGERFNVLDEAEGEWITVETRERDAEAIENLFQDVAEALMGPDRGYHAQVVCNTDNDVVLGSGRYAKDADGAVQTGLDEGEYVFEPTGADCPE